MDQEGVWVKWRFEAGLRVGTTGLCGSFCMLHYCTNIYTSMTLSTICSSGTDPIHQVGPRSVVWDCFSFPNIQVDAYNTPSFLGL